MTLTDERRFATVSAPAEDDSAFLRRAKDAGLLYRNSPGADPALLGVRDVIMADVGRQIKALEERLDDLDRRRPAAAPVRRRSTGLTWEQYKAMDTEHQRTALESASDRDMALVYAGKAWEGIMVLERRLTTLEKSLNGEGLESLMEVDK
jgi:hypothetical protein